MSFLPTESRTALNDLDFKKYVHEYCDMESQGHDNAEDDSSYYSDDDIPSDNNEEVDMITSTCISWTAQYLIIIMTMLRRKRITPTTHWNLNLIRQFFSAMFLPNQMIIVSITLNLRDVITVDEGAATTAEANNNSDNEEADDAWDESWIMDFMLDEQQKFRVNAWVGLNSIAEE